VWGMEQEKVEQEIASRLFEIDPTSSVHADDRKEVIELTATVFDRNVAVTISRSEVDARSGYAFFVEITDVSTGRQIARGNGGPSLYDALEIFHWRSVKIDLEAAAESEL